MYSASRTAAWNLVLRARLGVDRSCRLADGERPSIAIDSKGTSGCGPKMKRNALPVGESFLYSSLTDSLKLVRKTAADPLEDCGHSAQHR